MEFNVYIRYSSICRLWIHSNILMSNRVAYSPTNVSLVIRCSLRGTKNEHNKRNNTFKSRILGMNLVSFQWQPKYFCVNFHSFSVTPCLFKRKIPQSILIAITAHADLYLAFSSFHAVILRHFYGISSISLRFSFLIHIFIAFVCSCDFSTSFSSCGFLQTK